VDLRVGLQVRKRNEKSLSPVINIMSIPGRPTPNLVAIPTNRAIRIYCSPNYIRGLTEMQVTPTSLTHQITNRGRQVC